MSPVKHTLKEVCPIKQESLKLARDVYTIEMECIREMEDYFDEDDFAKAVELLQNDPRIGTAG